MTTPSYTHIRLFRPDCLRAPRGFEIPSVLVEPLPELALEIGAGKGRHALMFACANPKTHLIAIERTQGKAQAFFRQNCPKNLSFVHADAIAWTVFALPPKCLSSVFILYPNPEPNNANQRWVNMPFFEFLLSRMKTGATMTLASNIDEYIDESEEKLKNIWRLPTKRYIIPKDSARTHFESKYLARGEVCQELKAVKPEGYCTRFDEMMAGQVR